MLVKAYMAAAELKDAGLKSEDVKFVDELRDVE